MTNLYRSKKIGPHEWIFRNQYLRLYRTQVHFDGFSKTFFVTELGKRVALLAVKGEAILLVRQYRFLINGLSWEIPGGGVSEGETHEEAVSRECFEETGVKPRSLKHLLAFNLTLDCVDNPTCIFFTKDFEIAAERPPNPHEIIEQAWIPLDQCLAMIGTGEIKDAMTIMGLLYYSSKPALESRPAQTLKR